MYKTLLSTLIIAGFYGRTQKHLDGWLTELQAILDKETENAKTIE